MYAAGIGQMYRDQNYKDFDGLLRQAAFSTTSRFYFPDFWRGIPKLNLKSIITTEPIGKSCLGGGDSGGPLFFQADQTLIGVSMGTLWGEEYDEYIQLYIRVPYFYNWIEYKTGLHMPTKCKDQAPVLH